MSRTKGSFRQFRIGQDDVGRRLDRVVRKLLSTTAIGSIYGAIRRGDIRINSNKVKGDYRLQADDELEISESLLDAASHKNSSLGVAADLPTWFRSAIIHENEAVLALNKPAGTLVHGSDSLDSMVRTYLQPTRPDSLSFTPGPLHRLDRNTSGVLIFSKSLLGARRFTTLLRSRSVEKSYIALVHGRLEKPAIWVDRLARDSASKTTKRAETGRTVECRVRPVRVGSQQTLVHVTMRSGFTHQIRAQAAANSHPLVADVKYGSDERRGAYLLHAWKLELEEEDPILGFRSLTAPLPRHFEARIDVLFGSGTASKIRTRG